MLRKFIVQREAASWQVLGGDGPPADGVASEDEALRTASDLARQAYHRGEDAQVWSRAADGSSHLHVSFGRHPLVYARREAA